MACFPAPTGQAVGGGRGRKCRPPPHASAPCLGPALLGGSWFRLIRVGALGAPQNGQIASLSAACTASVEPPADASSTNFQPCCPSLSRTAGHFAITSRICPNPSLRDRDGVSQNTCHRPFLLRRLQRGSREEGPRVPVSCKDGSAGQRQGCTTFTSWGSLKLEGGWLVAPRGTAPGTLLSLPHRLGARSRAHLCTATWAPLRAPPKKPGFRAPLCSLSSSPECLPLQSCWPVSGRVTLSPNPMWVLSWPSWALTLVGKGWPALPFEGWCGCVGGDEARTPSARAARCPRA